MARVRYVHKYLRKKPNRKLSINWRKGQKRDCNDRKSILLLHCMLSGCTQYGRNFERESSFYFPASPLISDCSLVVQARAVTSLKGERDLLHGLKESIWVYIHCRFTFSFSFILVKYNISENFRGEERNFPGWGPEMKPSPPKAARATFLARILYFIIKITLTFYPK